MPVDADITDQGPPTFTLPQVRAANVLDWQGKFGADADTDPESTDGQLIDIYSLLQSILLANQVRLWADSFVRSARGPALDALLDMFGKTRLPAVASSGTTVFYGDPATAIPLSTQVQTVNSAVLFQTTAAGSTGAAANSDTWMVRFNVVVTPAATYRVDIDGTDYDYVAIGGDTTEDVAREIRDLINAGADGTALLAGVDSTGQALMTVDVTGGPGNVTGDTIGGIAPVTEEAVRLAVEALNTGPQPAPAGTLQVLPSPIAGIQAASNDADAALGRNTETDDEFRARHFTSLFAPGCGTDQAIRADVLEAMDAQGIDFVVSANVTSNRSNVIDGDGRPPHSFETVVRYNDSPPSNANALVAEAIAACMPAGIEPAGVGPGAFTAVVEVYPGNFVNVSATLVVTLYLHLSITVSAGENFPTTGNLEQQIAQDVAAAWDLITLEGQDWYRTGSVAAVSDSVGGTALDIVITSDLTALPTDIPVFAAVASQAAAVREIIDLAANRVDVTIV